MNIKFTNHIELPPIDIDFSTCGIGYVLKVDFNSCQYHLRWIGTCYIDNCIIFNIICTNNDIVGEIVLYFKENDPILSKILMFANQRHTQYVYFVDNLPEVNKNTIVSAHFNQNP